MIMLRIFRCFISIFIDSSYLVLFGSGLKLFEGLMMLFRFGLMLVNVDRVLDREVMKFSCMVVSVIVKIKRYSRKIKL